MTGLFLRRSERDGGRWLLLSAGLSGCGSTTVEQAVPAASTTPVSGISTGEPKDTGTFPNLNVTPQAATTQISPEEKQAHIDELHTAQQGQAATAAAGKAPTNPVLLRKLAATHAEDALKRNRRSRSELRRRRP